MKETTKQTFLVLAEKHRSTPFTLTPGKRVVMSRFNGNTGNFYMAPAVVLAEQDGYTLFKHPCGKTTYVTSDADIEDVSPHEWARCLWNLSANQRKAAA